jgi:hypothetical protein
LQHTTQCQQLNKKFKKKIIKDLNIKIALLIEAQATARDAILHGRGALESVLDNCQTNAVLGELDDAFAAALAVSEAMSKHFVQSIEIRMLENAHSACYYLSDKQNIEYLIKGIEKSDKEVNQSGSI